MLLLRIRIEDVFDGQSEEFRNLECQRQARRVFSGFQRIDRLTRDSQTIRHFGLRPFAFRTQNAQAVLHPLYFRETNGVAIAHDAMTTAYVNHALGCGSFATSKKPYVTEIIAVTPAAIASDSV